MGPTKAMTVVDNAIEPNVREENLSSPEDLKANPPVSQTTTLQD